MVSNVCFLLFCRISEDFSEASFVPSSNWNAQNGYTKLRNFDSDSYPYRVFGIGVPSSINVILKTDKRDIDDLCGSTVQGFKIKFHNPSNDLQFWKETFQLSPESFKLFLINAKSTVAKEEIRKYSPDVRRCYYPSERQLRYYKKYSLANCENECMANYTLDKCGCVKFSMPRKYFALILFRRIELRN